MGQTSFYPKKGTGGIDHYLGWFLDYAALVAAYPTAVDGDYAILGSTDTVWIWDTATMGWIDSGVVSAALDVKDEGVLVEPGVDEMDFQGSNIAATPNGAGKVIVTVTGHPAVLKTTSISATGSILSGAVYDVTTGFVGVDYTTSGDTGDLKATASLFNNNEGVMVFLNGMYLIKGVDVVWATATTFVLNFEIDNTDEIIALS